MTKIVAYDSLGRITSEQQCVLARCSSSNPSVITYDYDFAGNLVRYDSGGSGQGQFSIFNHFDEAGRLQSISSGWASPNFGGDPLLNITSFAITGEIKAADIGPNLTLSQAYDARRRVISSNVIAK